MRGTGTKAEGAANRIKRKIQHTTGELTDNDEMKAKGRGNKAKGKMKEMMGRVQNAGDALKG